MRANAERTHFGPHQALIARDMVADADGQEHVRFDRTSAGQPVLGGDLVGSARGKPAARTAPTPPS